MGLKAAATRSEPWLGEFDRCAVLIDYMNAYEGAMRAVGADRSNPGTEGQFDPLEVARLLQARRQKRTGRCQSLVFVGVYRGMPAPRRNPERAAQASRQVERWKTAADRTGAPLVVRTRPLSYRYGRPQEKGVDVMLAVDLVKGTLSGQFDAAVVFTGDTDLLPAIEAATGMGVVCDSASWVGGARRLRPPRVAYEHRLDLDDYHQARDDIDYSRTLRHER